MLAVSEQRMAANRAILPHAYPSGIVSHASQRSYVGTVRDACILPHDLKEFITTELTLKPRQTEMISTGPVGVNLFDVGAGQTSGVPGHLVEENFDAAMHTLMERQHIVKKWPTLTFLKENFLLTLPQFTELILEADLARELGFRHKGQAGVAGTVETIVFKNTKSVKEDIQGEVVAQQSGMLSPRQENKRLMLVSVTATFPGEGVNGKNGAPVQSNSASSLCVSVNRVLSYLCDMLNISFDAVKARPDPASNSVVIYNERAAVDNANNITLEVVLGRDLKKQVLFKEKSLLFNLNSPCLYSGLVLEPTTDLLAGKTAYFLSSLGSMPAVITPRLGRHTILAIRLGNGLTEGKFIQTEEMPLITVDVYDKNFEPLYFTNLEVKLRMEYLFEPSF